MKAKKLIKLINDERLNSKAISGKGCDENSTDHCYTKDYAQCQVYSIDICATKDLAACVVHSEDVCALELDTAACYVYEADYT